MNARRSNDPFAVQVPTPKDDRPSWVKVGVIAALGFAIGVAWPRLAGVRLGPTAPGDTTTAARAPEGAAATPEPAAPTTAQPPTVGNAGASGGTGVNMTVPAAAFPAAVPSASGAPAEVALRRGAVIGCKTQDGEFRKGTAACGTSAGFEAAALGKFKRLSSCSAAQGAEGKLLAVITADFAANKVMVSVDKKSTVENQDTFRSCLQLAFDTVNLASLEHEHPRYTYSFSLALTPRPGGAVPAGVASPSASIPAAGTASSAIRGGKPVAAVAPLPPGVEPEAQVVLEVAIVRDAPRMGQVVGRLPRGSHVKLGASQDGWYRVKYGPTFSSEGWVYRGTIGR